jgi:hypothetical protein
MCAGYSSWLDQEEQAVAVRSALNGIIAANSAAGRSSSTTGDASTSEVHVQIVLLFCVNPLAYDVHLQVDTLRIHSAQFRIFAQELSQEEYVNLMSVLEAELLMEEDMLARESQQAALAAFEVRQQLFALTLTTTCIPSGAAPRVLLR